ncbi:hypothetical protein JQ600_35440 [Bradyrhizobium sp. AUGA SZCCT0176]|uniref:hypothetical protein n=1 Tax=Bradyrhizobium sp. AUGA SZCCT0176 TaxID=2807664 RepID=UPI001BAD5A79|nr:hypothetical protein [Bradyrhizobium sp. AUGA SZCCT0176]MBR1230191.1 hypothetical protein [Bradyrhizobium sp. AUGA SZCCT0176]
MTLEQGFLVAGFLITWTSGVIGLTRAVSRIKEDTSEKIASEELARTEAIAAASAARNEKMDGLRRDFNEAQRAQDNNVGEMGAALRRFIETVEKEMHAIEIWGRDNYVQKGEFERATDRMTEAIKAMGTDIKSDFRERLEEMSKRINGKH